MDDIEKFSKGLFRADCAIIRLHREGQHPILLEGPGHIAQDATKNLTFAVHLANDAIVALMKEINRPRQAGMLIPREDYLTFTAQSYNGRVWESTLASVRFTMGLGTGGVASASLRAITNKGALPGEQEKDYAQLVVRDNVKFPETGFTQTQIVRGGETITVSSARDFAKFTAGQEEFVLARNDEVTELHCAFEKGGIEKFRHIRIQEAMQFALGQLFEPCVVETFYGAVHQKTFRSVGIRGEMVRQNPPLEFRDLEVGPEVYEIAKAYYSAIIDHVDENWHELSSHVYFLVQAGSSPIELQSLAIGVSAEAIAAACFPALAPVEIASLEEVSKCQEQVAKLGLSERLYKRLHGALGAMKNPRTADKVRAFVTDYGFDKRLFESWQRLRNTAAHGSKIKGQDIAETLASLDDVLFLCYAMILKFCRYTGRRTDYSTPGHPEITPNA